MGKFNNKMARNGKAQHIIFSKCHTKVAILVESGIAKKSVLILSLSFVILTNNKMKIAKPR